ncbi:MAG: hypothetical protein K2O44_04040 [Clostridia bacterium]|nr:hypothetical protein [Clostridia bacterium]
MTKVKVKNRPTIKEYLKERFKNVPLTVLMAAFTAFCFASLIYFAVIGGHSRDCIISMVYFLIVPVFYVLEYSLNVRAPLGYTIFMLLFVLFCFLGACYNFYTLIPFLDDVLHAAWGIVFGVIGIVLVKFLIGPPKTIKGVIACVLFGIGFAMILSIIWEIYEYVGDKIIPDMDMQEDTIVRYIHSFMMHDPYDHLHTWKVDDIVKTIIIDADGNEFVIEGGYLDVGIVDTMQDLIWCFGTIVVFSVILAVDWCKGKYLYRFVIPALRGEQFERITAAQQESVESAEAEEEEPAEEATTGEVAEEENKD